MGLTEVFLWVPAHRWSRNQKADKTAKKVIQSYVNLTVKTIKSETRSIIKERLKKKWQRRLEGDNRGR